MIDRWRSIGFDFQILVLVSAAWLVLAVLMIGWGISAGGICGDAAVVCSILAAVLLAVLWVIKIPRTKALKSPQGERLLDRLRRIVGTVASVGRWQDFLRPALNSAWDTG